MLLTKVEGKMLVATGRARRFTKKIKGGRVSRSHSPAMALLEPLVGCIPPDIMISFFFKGVIYVTSAVVVGADAYFLIYACLIILSSGRGPNKRR